MFDAQNDARVLIVDDDPLVVRLLVEVLSDAGYRRIESARSSADVIAAWEDVRPDALLVDVHMPYPDGITLLSEIRAHEQREDDWVPVIMITGDATAATRSSALAAGATDFLMKPFDPIEVQLRLRNALALRRHRLLLEQRVSRRTAELEVARVELLQRLGLTAEFRDDETHRHTERVGHTAWLLAKALAPDQADVIRRAAPLHDIGKVGIPDAILLKPGSLTAAERERMERHTEIGRLILRGSASPVLRVAEEIAYTHHERWDGLGYPRQIAGAAIPLSGRVTAVADVFDALTHARPYKGAMPVEEAVAHILGGAGSRFDPDVVEAFSGLAHEQLADPPSQTLELSAYRGAPAI